MQRFIAPARGLLLLALVLSGGVFYGTGTAATSSDRQLARYEVGAFGGIMDYDHDRDLTGKVFGGRLGVNMTPKFGVEGMIGASRATSPIPGIDPRTIWISNVALVLTPVRGIVEPYVAGGLGSLSSTRAGADPKNGVNFNGGAGIRVWMNERWALRADYHGYWTGVDNGAGFYQDLMVTAGVSVGLGGSPLTPPDADLDGVPDPSDRCAATPLGTTVDSFGCPLDSDHDGVPDYDDRCASTPASAKVDAKGCPADSDNDGVLDGIDRCSNTPKQAKADANGCPIDSDGDGVFDGIDRCAGTQSGATVNAEGCVSLAPPIPDQPQMKWLVLRNVTFISGKAEIAPSAFRILDEIAGTLSTNSEVRIEIRGYADSRGSNEANMALTQRRAEAVRQYLILRGVDGSRLRARACGESDPVATNDTSEGRAMNRRVELHRE